MSSANLPPSNDLRTLEEIGLDAAASSAALSSALNLNAPLNWDSPQGTSPVDARANHIGQLLRDNPSALDLGVVEAFTGVSPELVLAAYEYGQFPMAEDRNANRLSWIEPSERGIIRLNDFRVPSRLKRTLKSSSYQVTCNLAFDQVIASCSAPDYGREDTWINDQILLLYGALHRIGFAHSIEVWDDTELVGGLYGLAINGTFFGESMFSAKRDTSKIALAHLVARMQKSRMTLLDCQFYTRHLGQFGATEIPQEGYLELVEANQFVTTQFTPSLTPDEFLAFLSTL